jgi:hypothetical protein
MVEGYQPATSDFGGQTERSKRSPHEAQRNAGTDEPLMGRPRISLRSIRATLALSFDYVVGTQQKEVGIVGSIYEG